MAIEAENESSTLVETTLSDLDSITNIVTEEVSNIVQDLLMISDHQYANVYQKN